MTPWPDDLRWWQVVIGVVLAVTAVFTSSSSGMASGGVVEVFPYFAGAFMAWTAITYWLTNWWNGRGSNDTEAA